MQVEDESVSYASKMSIADGRLTWTEPAEQILARFRGVTPRTRRMVRTGRKTASRSVVWRLPTSDWCSP